LNDVIRYPLNPAFALSAAQSSKPKKTKTNPFAVSSPQPQKLKRSTSFFEAVDSMIPKSPAGTIQRNIRI
jgi:hypothetical protein